MDLQEFIKSILKEELQALEVETTGFSIDELNACETLEEAQEYVENRLKKVGQGIYRKTYEIDGKTVLKILRSDGDEVDFEQNANESRNSSCLGKKYAVQLTAKHHEFWWIAEEKIQPLSLEAFISELEKRLGPIPSFPQPTHSATQQATLDKLDSKENTFMMALEFAVGSPASSSPYNIKAWMNNPWYKGLIAGLRKCQVEAHDFHHKNWGIRPGSGELIILDLGF